MRGAPRFFVICSRGESGPYDHHALREALQAGEITGQDQVRSPLGSPLGTVQQVLMRDSDRTMAQRVSDQSGQERIGGSRLIPIFVVVVIILGLLALFGVWPGGSSEPSIPVPSAPVPSTPPLDRGAAAPSTSQAEPGQRSQRPTPAEPVAQAKKPVLSRTQPVEKPKGDNLFAGLSSRRWSVGKGARISDQGGGVRLELNATGLWAGYVVPPGRRNMSGSRGLILELADATAAQEMQLEIIEQSGERFVAAFRLDGTAQQEVSIPWSAFSRREWQEADSKGAAPPDDGLQSENIRFITVWPTETGVIFRIWSMRLDR